MVHSLIGYNVSFSFPEGKSVLSNKEFNNFWDALQYYNQYPHNGINKEHSKYLTPIYDTEEYVMEASHYECYTVHEAREWKLAQLL